MLNNILCKHSKNTNRCVSRTYEIYFTQVEICPWRNHCHECYQPGLLCYISYISDACLNAILHDHSQERAAMATLTVLQTSERFSHYARTLSGQWPAPANINVLFNSTSAGYWWWWNLSDFWRAVRNVIATSSFEWSCNIALRLYASSI